jgi:putative transposase
MARLTRLSLSGLPHHLMQIGNNRQPIFVDDEDRAAWCAHLREASLVAKVDVHAYALMDNHVHLLATPRESAEGLSTMMQSLGRRYVAGFNRRHARSGTLWEGRFRAALVDPDDSLLPCMRYIDSHAQRSGLCVDASAYAWSSCAHHLGHRRDPLIVDHARYWALGNTPFEREDAFRNFLGEGVSLREAQAISQATRRGWPIAGVEGQRRLALKLGCDIVPRPRGRPRRAAELEPTTA